MHWSAMLVVLLLFGGGCRLFQRKDTLPPTPAPSTTPVVFPNEGEPKEELVPATHDADEGEPATDTKSVVVLGTAPEDPEVIALEEQIAVLEQRLANGRKEIAETCARLRTNRERRLGRIRSDLHEAANDFNRRLDDLRLAKEGESR